MENFHCKPDSEQEEIDLYTEWVQKTNQKDLTKTQGAFAKWLLKEEQKQKLLQVGNLDDIFISVRRFLKS